MGIQRLVISFLFCKKPPLCTQSLQEIADFLTGLALWVMRRLQLGRKISIAHPPGSVPGPVNLVQLCVEGLVGGTVLRTEALHSSFRLRKKRRAVAAAACAGLAAAGSEAASR